MPMDLWFSQEIKDVIAAIELPMKEVQDWIERSGKNAGLAEAYIAGYQAALDAILEYLHNQTAHCDTFTSKSPREESHDLFRECSHSRKQQSDRPGKACSTRTDNRRARLAPQQMAFHATP